MDNGRARTWGGARCGWAFCFLGIVPLALQFNAALYALNINFSIYTSLIYFYSTVCLMEFWKHGFSELDGTRIRKRLSEWWAWPKPRTWTRTWTGPWGGVGWGDLGWGGGSRWGWAFLFFFTLFRLHDHVIQLAPSAKMLGCCSIHTSLGLFLWQYFVSDVLICILSGSCSSNEADNLAWHCSTNF